MRDFERTSHVEANADKAFQFLANPTNLPRYVARMTTASPTSGGQMHVAAEVQGRHEEGESRFQADASRQRLEWSGDSSGGYGGWLQIEEAGSGSDVTIHLHVAHDEDQAEIERTLDETAANIERLLS